MKKILGLMLASVVLNGCVHPTDRAQQYLDGTLSNALNRTEQIQSDVPRDFTEFSRQSELVVENSPSLAALYQPLYQHLQEWVQQSGDPAELQQYGIQAAQLRGGDQRGNVLFTGYFSPVIELRHTPDAVFRYPLYGQPAPTCDETCPTRAQIYAGALHGLGLELGYAANLIDPFIMEVQGSGFVHFGDDDSLEYFAYAGKNNKAYVSIGKVLIEQGEIPRKKMSLKAIKHWVMTHQEEEVKALLEQNPSYVFFEPRAAAPVTGSAGIQLLPMASVAGDRRLFPMGTPILAEVPLLNADGSWSGTHELRLLIVLDTGGAVKDNHLDLYHGMGERAGIEAGHYRHFGRVWKLGLENSSTQAPWALPPEKLE
ncbi:murein transglycosylase A [Vibrio mangrovi]|uniref:peptidoglycan lytic exotransglycosylase n=1 Tax=Vibrio mangrovi TaxID=474394 RepID=A0A1Y6IUY2_9VIBR|nr:murein transglycosylase A [Vibrio mangrovi]MDW6001671.1 murein transglycosylase A [Vibrio mangrovi]SMS00302.1 Membrane-bound lytic murein transglycosylase A precursor [Vibrio mangrovi]